MSEWQTPARVTLSSTSVPAGVGSGLSIASNGLPGSISE